MLVFTWLINYHLYVLHWSGLILLSLFYLRINFPIFLLFSRLRKWLDEDPVFVNGQQFFSFYLGYYSYCCHGVYCPDCPLKLNYSLMGEKHLLHPSVPMDCRNYSFSIRPETEVQPGNYSIKVIRKHGEHLALIDWLFGCRAVWIRVTLRGGYHTQLLRFVNK